jgi:hypothetical protein
MSSLKDKRSSRTDTADPTPAAQPTGVVIGRVVGVTGNGAPLVDFPSNATGVPVPALATACYRDVPPGQAVALMFLDSDPARPLAIGVVMEPDAKSECVCASPAAKDGERLTLTAAREIVLQCGRASIVLTRAGKVLVRGTYLSLRSSGMQRITGASVQIN